MKGVFGFSAVAEIGMTLGANPKSGLDTIKFAEYLNAKIVPVYPDTSDTSGKLIVSLFLFHKYYFSHLYLGK